ncbi:serine/arginine repetitive matrix protein 1-like isoform X2 [Dermacentor albipictus]|uniref:serine/arginine repetitive matrix protein 1-like isoform X2 n=1 Tax=Dermacentor albipictus TaxID=60249 RepID=UPI0038FCC9CA
MRSGGRDTPRSQHSPTSSILSPPPERGGEVREAGEEISPKRTASPNRGASPANLHEKTVASDSPSSARPNTSARASPRRGGTPTRRASPVRADPSPKPGAAATPKPHSAKDEVAAKPADDAGSTRSPTETRRRPTISLKDPRFRYIAQALMAARGGRGAGGTSGSSSPNGRTSPSATPYFASDDDNTILELGTSQVPHSPGGFGGRSSGTASPVISQRASIQLSSAFRNKSSAFHPGSEIGPSVRTWPWRESANDNFSPSNLRHGNSQSPLAGGTKYDGQKRSKPSFLVLTGACLLALLLSAIVLVVVLHMISIFYAPSGQEHAGQSNTNTSTKSPRFGTGVADTSGVGGSATEVGRVQTSPPPYSSWRHA